MRKIIALLLVCILCAAFAACSGKTADETDAVSGTSAPDMTADAPTDAVTSAPVVSLIDSGSSSGAQGEHGDKYATLADYLEAAEWKETFDGIKNMLGDDTTIECYAEGDTLVYDIKYTETYSGTALDTMRESLQESLDNESSAQNFIGVAESLRECVTVSDPAVKVIYHNGDGSVIAQKTYYPD